MKEQLTALAELVGGKGIVHGEFPGWAYRPESKLREVMMDSYEELYGKRPEILTIHAGLECGLFIDKNPELDCVSFGPALSDVHSPAESMDIASVARSYDYLLAILKNCK
jgi:dipeptidase D